EVIDAAVAFLGNLEIDEKVASAVGARMDDPAQVYFFMSDVPEFTVLNEVAGEIGSDLNTVLKSLSRMYPRVTSLYYLTNKLDEFDLEDIVDGKDAKTVERFAKLANVPTEFVVRRCKKLLDNLRPPEVEELDDEPEDVADEDTSPITEADKILKAYIDQPRNPDDRADAYITKPEQLTGMPTSEEEWDKARVEDGYIYIATALDQWPYWIKLTDIQRFAQAHGLMDVEEEVDEHRDDFVLEVAEDHDDEESEPEPEKSKGPELMLYVDQDFNSPLEKVKSPDDITYADSYSDVVEVYMAGDYMPLYVKKDEYDVWVKAHGRAPKNH